MHNALVLDSNKQCFSYKLTPFKPLKWMLPIDIMFGESQHGRAVSLVRLLKLCPEGSFHQNIDSIVMDIG